MSNISTRAKIIGLITVCLVLVAGLVLGIVLKFNTNFELGGYTEFSVTIESTDEKVVKESVNSIREILNNNGLKYDATITSTEDVGTKLTTRYLTKAKGITVALVNGEIKDKLDLTTDDFAHTYYEGKISKAAGLTAIALGIVVVLFSIFASIRYARYTGLVTLISAIVGTGLYLSITALLRLTVGASYFALLVLLNLVIMYYEVCLFEATRKKGNIVEAIDNALIDNRKNMSVLAVGIAIVSLLFVVIAPTSLKFVSLDLMFVPVVSLAIGLYIAPYLFIVFTRLFTKKSREVKTK